MRAAPALALAAMVCLALVVSPPAARGQGAEDEASLLVREARQALAERDYHRAGELLDRALAVNPRQVHVYVLRASAYGAEKQHQRAVSLLERALELAPANLDVSSALGVQLVLAGRTARGVALLEKVVARDSSRYDAQVVLGRHYARTGAWPAAVSALEAYFDHRPRSLASTDPQLRIELARAYLRGGDPVRARAAYRAVLRSSPGDRAARLGILWSTAAIDCRAVPSMLRSARDLERDYPRVGLVAGLCALERKQLGEAEGRARSFIARRPRDPRGWGLLAAVRRGRGDLPGAFDGFARAAELAPGDARWALELARVERMQGHAAAAAARLRRAGAPVGREAAWTLELAESLLADRKPAGARALLAAFVSEHPDDARAQRLLGTALLRLGQTGDAIAALERAIAIGGSQATAARAPLAAALEARAREAVKRRDAVAAAADAGRAVELAPTRERRILVAGARIAGGRPADAVAPLEALRDRPTARSLALLARAYRGAGRHADSVAVLEQLIELPAASDGVRRDARMSLAAALLASGRSADAVAALEPAMSAPNPALIAAYTTAARASATAHLADGAHWKAYRVLAAAEKHLAAGDPRLIAVRCDLALAATGAGQRDAAMRRLAQLRGAQCPFPAPADTVAVPILAAWNRGTDPARAGAALAALQRLRRAATGAARPLWVAAVQDVGLRAAADAHRAGRVGAARRYLEAARAGGPASAQVEHGRAVLLLDARKLDDAIALLGRIASSVPEAHLNLGIAYERKGEPRRALAHYERALAAGVSHPRLKAWIASLRRVWGSE